MRLVWWKDAINDTLNGNPPKHPVLEAISAILEQNPLTKTWFTRIITARTQNLLIRQYPTTEELEKYLDATQSSLLYLCLEAMGLRSVELEHAAGHYGKAIGFTQTIRGLPNNASRDLIYVPAELFAKHELRANETLSYFRDKEKRTPEVSKKLSDVVYELASIAHGNLEEADVLYERAVQKLTSEQRQVARSMKLYSLPTRLYLKKLETSANFDVLVCNHGMALSRVTLPFKFWMTK